MADSRNVMLGLLSAGLVVTWTYHLVDKSSYTNKRREVFIKDSAAIAQAVGDSLQKLYNSTISSLDIKLDSINTNAGLLQGELGNKILEINRLKTEIGSILRRTDVSKQDLAKARTLTAELKTRIDELQNQNRSIEDEKNQISSEFEVLNTQVTALTQTNTRLDQENKKLNEKLSDAGTFVASELRLSAVQTKSNKETEALLARKAEKFVISFLLQNNVTSYENSEIFVVLTDPNEQVLEFSAWDTGLFDTKTEGRKKYSRKLRFAYSKGESHEIIFSLNAPEYVKGKYLLQVYHNGNLVGKAIKILS
jgi:regulator of replication initiation timing